MKKEKADKIKKVLRAEGVMITPRFNNKSGELRLTIPPIENKMMDDNRHAVKYAASVLTTLSSNGIQVFHMLGWKWEKTAQGYIRSTYITLR